MARVYQFVAGFSQGDAISTEARLLRDAIRGWGYDSAICCEHTRILPELRREAVDFRAVLPALRPEDVVLLHLSIASPLNEAFRTVPCRKAVLYHNVTPAHYFALINPATARYLEQGRIQMQRLRDAAEVVLADSAFNAAELREAGYPPAAVLPPAIDLRALRAPADPRMLRALDGDGVTVLFVGRCAPNKRLDDVLVAFARFQHAVSPDARLVFAGSYAGAERYYALLRAAARELGVRGVRFTGSIPQAALNACYRRASLFLSMSEHEGFGMPLLEAMALDVPVLAFEAAAVPETLDGAGVLFRDKTDPALLELMGRLARPSPLREAVLRRQRERLARYEARDPGAALRVHLAPLLEARA
jgi:glycosyltransferase involved in cell wall biosynthesis